jgi:hypothetical protein
LKLSLLLFPDCPLKRQLFSGKKRNELISTGCDRLFKRSQKEAPNYDGPAVCMLLSLLMEGEDGCARDAPQGYGRKSKGMNLLENKASESETKKGGLLTLPLLFAHVPHWLGIIGQVIA